MSMPSMTKTLLLTAALLMGIACNDSTSPPAPAAIASVTVAPSPSTLLVGSTAQLTATTKDSAGNVLTGRAVTWASSNTAVATVSAAGLVTAVAVGSATITATAEGKNGTVAVTVILPPPVPVVLTFATVSAGNGQTCGVTTGGTAYCWGYGFSPTPVAVTGGHTFVSVSAGGELYVSDEGDYSFNYACSVATGGAAYCWGDNSYGQLGTDSTTSGSSTPVAVAGGHTFMTVSAGAEHTCGVTTESAAYCWGDSFSPTPVAVAGGYAFVTVSAGGGHTCGVTTGGAAYCWGNNVYGELGTGTMTNNSTPVAVLGGYTFAMVSAGADHTCGVTTGGVAYCWGMGFWGGLGDGTTNNSSMPVKVAGQP